MTQTLHIIAKDLSRLRWLLLLWIVILAVRVSLWSLDVSVGDGVAYAFLVGQSIVVIGTLQTLMLALLAVRLARGAGTTPDSWSQSRMVTRAVISGRRLRRSAASPSSAA